MEIVIPIIAGISTAALVLFIVQSWKGSPVKSFFEKKRIRRFNNQLVDTLTTMSNSLKAGLSLIQAIETVEKEMDPPISEEFGMVAREHKMGVNLEESLQHLADRIRSDDIRLLVTSVTIAHELGANLAEIFENIATTIRERNRIHTRIETLTAQGKMQGIVVSALPVGLGLILYFLAPDMISLLFTTQLGRFLLAMFLILQLSGWVIIKRIVAIDV